MLDKAAAESGCVDIDDEAEELVYGEFGMPLFCALIDGLEPSASTTFVDFGSGRGQLVLAAAKGEFVEWDG